MRRAPSDEGFNFDYLHDEDQSLARALGSERTPEVFVFDRDRRLVYHGAIDDNRDEDGGQRTTSATPSTPCWRASRRRETRPGRLHGQVALSRTRFITSGARGAAGTRRR